MARQTVAQWLAAEIRRQEQWIADCGQTLAGYVAHYGAAADPDHYGSGGEAIYAADTAALQALQARARRGRR